MGTNIMAGKDGSLVEYFWASRGWGEKEKSKISWKLNTGSGGKRYVQ